MKKKKNKKLNLTREVIKIVRLEDLNQIRSGCNTTSWTTDDAPPKI